MLNRPCSDSHPSKPTPSLLGPKSSAEKYSNSLAGQNQPKRRRPSPCKSWTSGSLITRCGPYDSSRACLCFSRSGRKDATRESDACSQPATDCTRHQSPSCTTCSRLRISCPCSSVASSLWRKYVLHGVVTNPPLSNRRRPRAQNANPPLLSCKNRRSAPSTSTRRSCRTARPSKPK
jgi:hypothetical protein